MSSSCLFCKIVAGKLPAQIVYENDDVLVFKDLEPKAPFHALAIPKKHIATLNDIGPEDAELIGKLSVAAKELAVEGSFDKEGFRTVMNCNEAGGQTVYHIHMHILSGRDMKWPPG